MEVRGERECKECGTRWSYYETGSPACPSCGSLYSVGRGERALHTDRPVELDLTKALEAFEEDPADAGRIAEKRAGTYLRKRGFLSGGSLRPLTETYLAAWEVREVARELRRGGGLRPETGLDLSYIRTLFEDANRGQRPGPAAVPDSMRQTHGLAIEAAISDYLADLDAWVDANEPGVDLRGARYRLDNHRRRLRALDGAIPPEQAEGLVIAARSIGAALAEDRIASVEAAIETLDGLEPDADDRYS